MPHPAPQIVHNVFFALHENSPEARQRLVDACWKYLTGHPGEVYFSAGVLCDALARPVNDRDFDVGLHVVFQTLAEHDAYQQHPRHLQFVEENKPNWKRVRVFDSQVHSPA
jgi:hypothetical protein